MPDVLPSCKTREERGGLWLHGRWCVPCYCMHCGCSGGYQSVGGGYVGYMCQLCLETHGVWMDQAVTPDQAFNALAVAEMVDQFGRPLTLREQRAEIAAGGTLAKLARDAPA